MMKKVVIIGGGPAGLSAAYTLLEKEKLEVVVLEKEQILGGISKTITFDGYKMDTGIHRFFSKSDRVNSLWQKLLPIQGKKSYEDKILKIEKKLSKNGPNPEKDDNVFLVKNRITRIYYNKKFFDYPVSLKKETIVNMGVITTISAGFSYLKSCIIKKKEDSLENFYINRFGEKLYGMFFKEYTEKVWGRSPKNISSDWGSQRVKGLSIKTVLKDMLTHNKNKTGETSLIDQFYYPKYGAGQMWDEMAKKIISMGGSILKGCDVSKINVEKNKIVSIEYVHNEEKQIIYGDIFISSMPIKDLVGNMQGKRIPKEVLEVASGLPYREFMSVGFIVDKINLKNMTNIKTLGNVIPDDWIYVHEPDVKMGRIQIFNNWSPYIFKNPKEMKDKVFFSTEYFCNESDEIWNMSDDDFIDFALNECLKMNILNSKDQVQHSVRVKVKKAYPAYFDTYKDIDKVINYLKKYENLYCIGRNGQHRYNNMDHSMLTGMLAADHILGLISNKDDIWNVNTEKVYHEEK